MDKNNNGEEVLWKSDELELVKDGDLVFFIDLVTREVHPIANPKTLLRALLKTIED